MFARSSHHARNNSNYQYYYYLIVLPRHNISSVTILVKSHVHLSGIYRLLFNQTRCKFKEKQIVFIPSSWTTISPRFSFLLLSQSHLQHGLNPQSVTLVTSVMEKMIFRTKTSPPTFIGKTIYSALKIDLISLMGTNGFTVTTKGIFLIIKTRNYVEYF
jgi:hypothetical protein